MISIDDPLATLRAVLGALLAGDTERTSEIADAAVARFDAARAALDLSQFEADLSELADLDLSLFDADLLADLNPIDLEPIDVDLDWATVMEN